MMIPAYIRIAATSLKANRVRTALTTLGIVIGVAAVTVVLALGEGAKQAVSQQISHMDETVILVRPGVPYQGPNQLVNYSPLASYAATTLTEQDLETAKEIKNISSAAPIMLINGSVKVNKTVAPSAPIVATEPELQNILGLEARQGQFLDGTTARDTAAIGEQLSIELYGTDQSIGRQITIRGRDHTVIGVLKNIKNPLGINGVDINRSVIVSLEDGKSFNQGIAQIQQISAKASNESAVPGAITELNKALLTNHNGENDFTIMRSTEADKLTDQYFQLLISVVSVIASISLVVGGIGIMNIMLVNVTERTREIGIRKSLGATNAHIFWQFLIEALTMSVAGGIVGFLVAYLLAYAVSFDLAFSPVISWSIFGVAMALSVLVGTVFGIFPAVRAANKDPIEALRQYQ